MSIFTATCAGYRGSRSCLELLMVGHDVDVFDDFSNRYPEALQWGKRIVGGKVDVVQVDIRDQDATEGALRQFRCQGAIHCVGLDEADESVENPLFYYDNNVGGTYLLLMAMESCGVETLAFCSSATFYGEPQRLPLTEFHPLSATIQYGRSKLNIEDMLRDLLRASANWRIAILPDFNPIGAHERWSIGECLQGIPYNLIACVAQAAVGSRDYLDGWSNDYWIPDGPWVSDGIHFVDTALAHLKALEQLQFQQCLAVNFAAGMGYSVLNVVKAFEGASDKRIACKLLPRHPGDVAACYFEPRLAEQVLGWKPEFNWNAICQDHWRWREKNPQGYV